MQRPVFCPTTIRIAVGVVIVTAGWMFALPSPCVAQAPPTPGTIDTARSRVYVFVGKKGAGHEHGVEGRVAGGEIHLERTQAVGGISFDLQTFTADTSAARRFFNLPGETDADTQAQVNVNMLGAAVLDTARFRTAEFVVNASQTVPPAAGQAGQPYRLDGEFTLHGVKRPLQFVATAEQAGGLIRLRGRFAIKQTDFGIKPFSKFLGAVGVADELQIFGDLYLQP
jgi:polyisoprenoid-binding protein YceI